MPERYHPSPTQPAAARAPGRSRPKPTLRDPEWNNTTVISGDPIPEIRRMKDQAGQDIVQYGFGQLSYALLEHGLLDELRLWVHPLFVGRATLADLMFRPTATAQLDLAGTLALNTGPVIL